MSSVWFNNSRELDRNWHEHGKSGQREASKDKKKRKKEDEELDLVKVCQVTSVRLSLQYGLFGSVLI